MRVDDALADLELQVDDDLDFQLAQLLFR